MYYDRFRIKDYPQNFLQCSVEEQKVLAIFEEDTGPYAREQFGYRKRTGVVKLKVKLPMVEEWLQLIVRITIEN